MPEPPIAAAWSARYRFAWLIVQAASRADLERSFHEFDASSATIGSYRILYGWRGLFGKGRGRRTWPVRQQDHDFSRNLMRAMLSWTGALSQRCASPYIWLFYRF